MIGRRWPRAALASVAIVGLVAAMAATNVVAPAGADSGEGSSLPIATDEGLITVGGLHTCAVEDDGQVQCWGANDHGQLGNGTTAASTEPTTVIGITTATEVSAGATHSCALIHDGSVHCWGNNGNGQLGNGATSPPSPPALAPVTVTAMDDATAIAAGGFHTCAIREDTTVACWGHDGSGQLGDGTIGGASSVPLTVLYDDDDDPLTDPVPLDGVTALAAGEYHTCAIVGATGEVRCWGHNGFGQVGDGTTDDHSLAVLVSDIPDDDGGNADPPHGALAIAAGEGHTCAVLDDNTARCWGQNFYGQLGDGTTFATSPDQNGTDSLVPVTVVFDANADPNIVDPQTQTGIVSITAGQFHTCAGLSGGGARCWGADGRGQLGDSITPQRNQSHAVPVDGIAGARAVTAGGFHSCALLAGNAMKCWGYNFYGQLGSYKASAPRPVTVTALSGATDVTTGSGHACARLTTPAYVDRPVCWGRTTTASWAPTSRRRRTTAPSR